MKLIVRLFGKNYFKPCSKYSNTIANFNDYYTHLIICKNCGGGTTVYIKKGVHINDVVTQVKCDACDCRLEKA